MIEHFTLVCSCRRARALLVWVHLSMPCFDVPYIPYPSSSEVDRGKFWDCSCLCSKHKDTQVQLSYLHAYFLSNSLTIARTKTFLLKSWVVGVKHSVTTSCDCLDSACVLVDLFTWREGLDNSKAIHTGHPRGGHSAGGPETVSEALASSDMMTCHTCSARSILS